MEGVGGIGLRQPSPPPTTTTTTNIALCSAKLPQHIKSISAAVSTQATECVGEARVLFDEANVCAFVFNGASGRCV